MIEKEVTMKFKKFIQTYEDKILHTGVNILIMEMELCPWYVCLCIAVIFSIGKEISDKYLKQTYFDCKDLLADAFGIIIGLIIRLNF